MADSDIRFDRSQLIREGLLQAVQAGVAPIKPWKDKKALVIISAGCSLPVHLRLSPQLFWLVFQSRWRSMDMKPVMGINLHGDFLISQALLAADLSSIVLLASHRPVLFWTQHGMFCRFE